MQIRVATRQDEPIIRTIINQANAEIGATEIDLTGRDSDLTNIEANYFWYDGIFLVAEEDSQIIAIVAARRGQTDKQLELFRLVVIPSRRRRGIARKLLETVLFFARNMEYEQLVFDPNKFGTNQNKPCLGFTAGGGIWNYELKTAFTIS